MADDKLDAAPALDIAAKLPSGSLQREFATDPDAGVKAMLILIGARLDSVHDNNNDQRDRLIRVESKIDELLAAIRAQARS